MNFSLDKFLKPLSDSDRNIQIYNNNDVVQFTINPFSVTRLNISNNLLRINLKYNKVHSLDFRTINEAKAALIKLQEQLDILRTKVPYSIDKQIQNYIDFNNNVISQQNTGSRKGDILIEDLWVESNLIPTDINDALSSTIVASSSATMSWVQNSYSFVIDPNQKTRVVPDDYGDFYQPLLFSSVDMTPISATSIPYWKISGDVITFYGGFPSTPVVTPTNPPIIKYFKYTGRLGSFNFVGGLTNIIETTGTSNIIPLTSNIRRDNIISVTINGILIYRWTYNSLNELIIDEASLGYQVEPTDLIRIETNTEPGGSFSVI
jgi:hypothetical protein